MQILIYYIHVYSLQKKKKEKAADASLKPRSASSDQLDKPQSELLTKELQQQSFSSVSRSFGGKMLFNALGARKSSMVRQILFSTFSPTY